MPSSTTKMTLRPPPGVAFCETMQLVVIFVVQSGSNAGPEVTTPNLSVNVFCWPLSGWGSAR